MQNEDKLSVHQEAGSFCYLIQQKEPFLGEQIYLRFSRIDLVRDKIRGFF